MGRRLPTDTWACIVSGAAIDGAVIDVVCAAHAVDGAVAGAVAVVAACCRS